MSKRGPGSLLNVTNRYSASLIVAIVGMLLMSLLTIVGFGGRASGAGVNLTDTFQRTTGPGFGVASSGQTWSAAAPFATDGSRGVINVAAGKSAQTLLGPTSADVTAILDVSYEAVPRGSYLGVVLRAQSDGAAYRVRLSNVNGALAVGVARQPAGVAETVLATVNSGLTLSGAGSVQLRTEVLGTAPVSIRAKVWKVGTTEPTGWQLDHQDAAAGRIAAAGSAGLWAYQSSAGASRILVDNLLVAPKSPAVQAISTSGTQPPATGPATTVPTTKPPTTPPVTTPPVTTPPVTTPPTTPPVTTPPTTPPVTTPPTTPPVTTPPVTTPPVIPPVVPQPPIPANGSWAVGQAQYQPPADAVWVDPVSGANTAVGTKTQPVQTVSAAQVKAGVNGTVVLKGGVYRESVRVTVAGLTVQAAPGEAVWFDGTAPVTGFAAAGAAWTAPWSSQFDHSSSFRRGDTAPPATDAWSFVNPSFPMAAWPDQVFVNGVAQVQVASAPSTGQFAVDYAAQRLVLGSDPTGKTVEASKLNRAFVLEATGVTLRGFGVRRFATSLPDMGTIVLAGVGGTLEQLVVTDSATQSISIQRANGLVQNVSVLRSGMTGIHGNQANGSTVRRALVQDTNIERFNLAPTSAGMKITRSRDITIVDNKVVAGLTSHGIWLDENVINFVIARNIATGNGEAAGMRIELCGIGIIAGNQVTGQRFGIQVVDAGDLEIYNNEFGSNSTQSLLLRQDGRYRPGHNEAGPNVQPSTENPWLVRNIRIVNNLFGTNNSGSGYQLYARDFVTGIAASDMNLTVTGNVFQQVSAGMDPMVVWGRPGVGVDPLIYRTPSAFHAAVNRPWTNVQVVGTATVPQLAAAGRGEPVTGSVATALGVPSGTVVLGRP